MIDQIIEQVSAEDYASLMKKINNKIKDYNDANFKLEKIYYFGMEDEDSGCAAFMLFEQLVVYEEICS